ncbi:MAG: SDR family NAD(P)-dependent oxidoreductase [Albidovulum sp.]|nr:SDR family NAD(P)-dependent oxidoreductase [Albidovulum sp.]MDE0532646.1 SDR family NAD(P)-dependent oxidoreductase [Albidovulum sp.]
MPDKGHDEGNVACVAFVTGASRGFGAAIAVELAKRGVQVIGLARSLGALQEVDDRIRAESGAMSIVEADITDIDSLPKIFRGVENRWGRIDIFVHAAVYAPPLSPAAHGDPREFRLSVETNIVATANLIGHANSLLRASGDGVAVFLEDDRAGEKFFGAYGSTKAAQIALARSWKRESGKIGPRVEIFAPRPMPTKTRKRFFPGEDGSLLANPADEAKRLVDAVF